MKTLSCLGPVGFIFFGLVGVGEVKHLLSLLGSLTGKTPPSVAFLRIFFLISPLP